MKRPKIKLSALEKTVISTPTQESFNQLLRVFEVGGWKWRGGESPTKGINYSLWLMYNEDTCLAAGEDSVCHTKGGIFGFGHKRFYTEIGWKFIRDQEFYKKQGTTSEQLDKVNRYFNYTENHKRIIKNSSQKQS